MKKERIKWVDEVRGVAILLVVLGHVIGGVDISLGGGVDNILWRIIYSFHMPLMFVISGIVDRGGQNQPLSIKIFFNKIIRLIVALYIPYLLWGYCFWAIKYFVYSGNETVTLQQGKELFWNCSGWGPGWYLLTLLLIKIINLAFDDLIKNNNVKIAIWVSLFLIGGWFQDIYLISRVLKYGIYYQIGKVFRNISLKENKIINANNCLNLLCIAAVLRFAGDLSYIMDFCIAVSISFLVILLFSQTENRSTPLEMLGESSMVLYVLHAYMTIPVRIILQKCNCENFAVFVIAETCVSVLGSFAIIKCMMYLKWIRYFFYPAELLRKFLK